MQKSDDARVKLNKLRASLYGIAGALRALAALSDVRKRGVSYTLLQDAAKQIENIADEGGE